MFGFNRRKSRVAKIEEMPQKGYWDVLNFDVPILLVFGNIVVGNFYLSKSFLEIKGTKVLK